MDPLNFSLIIILVPFCPYIPIAAAAAAAANPLSLASLLVDEAVKRKKERKKVTQGTAEATYSYIRVRILVAR